MFKISQRSNQHSRRYGISKSYPIWITFLLYHFYTKKLFFNRICLSDVMSPRILIISLWNFEHLINMVISKKKSEFFIKLVYFTQKWNFFIRVYILISCLSLSSVLNNSTQKLRPFSQRYMINIIRFAFFYFDMSKNNSEFFIRLIFWSNFNWWTKLDCTITSHLYHILLAQVYFL